MQQWKEVQTVLWSMTEEQAEQNAAHIFQKPRAVSENGER
jgi:hypothetical protein